LRLSSTVSRVCCFAVRGNAGWNYRVVYDGRRWIKHSLIPGVVLFDCGGISEMVLIQSSVIPELPESEIQIDPISLGDKLLTVWGRLRGQ